MAQRSALLQTCSNPAAVADGYSETPAKLLALDSILEELIKRQREKVVVWSFYRHSLSAIFARYRTYNPVRLDGSVTDPALRREAVRRFQEDDETMLFIGNPAAAGAGITLHRARYAVYESLSNQAAHYLQSLDRIHRRGQRRAVEYVVLLCTGTLEETEYARLLRKQASARELLGDDVDETPTREAMLREALDAARAIGLSDDRLASSMKNKR
jgi:SNF2 family DNA or RNA helicase